MKFKEDFKDAILPVCLAMSVIFNCVSINRMFTMQNYYSDALSREGVKAKTIEKYSIQIDELEQEIEALKSQIPQ